MKTVTYQVPDNREEFNKLLSEGDDEFLAHAPSYWDYYLREYLLKTDNFPVYSNTISRYLSNAHHLIGRMADPDVNYHDLGREVDNYPCIPLDPDTFILLLAEGVKLLDTKNLHKIKFCDAGCGVGDKVILASDIFNLDSFGVEYDPFIYKIARNRLFKKAILGDITTHDFSPYDIIYAYNPMHSYEGMKKFFDNLVKTARNGAIILLANVSSGGEAFQTVEKYFTVKHGNESGGGLVAVRKNRNFLLDELRRK